MSSTSFFTNPVRTNEDFTTGIVNVPLNTPAFLNLIVRDMKKLEQAVNVFEYYKIPFEIEQKRHKAILKATQLVNRDHIEHVKNTYPEFEPITKNYYRYVFFELDDLEEAHVKYVLSIFADYKLPVYYHRTMRGWHFFCVKPQAEEHYHAIMERLKPLNMACPHITMRIRPNKWVRESEIFRIHEIVMPALHSDTIRFASMVTNQTYFKSAQKIGTGKWLLDRKYLLVDYRQTGENANR